MSGHAPIFDQVNLIVTDMDAALAFYRRLGLTATDPVGSPGTGAKHVAITMPSGARLEIDNVEMGQLWHPALRAEPAIGRVVLGFALASRDAVDELFAKLTAHGDPGVVAPYDAFWGGRYAIVEDPDGHQIGLMSPTEATSAAT